MRASLGIDISKLNFDAALLIEKKFYCKKFSNSENGYKKLGIWLQSKNVRCIHACMEATGNYGLKLAEFLSDLGYVVSLINPASIKGFAQSQLTRNKTDKADAKLIARFTQALIPAAWVPPRAEVRELRDWVDRCENLKGILVQEKNRLEMQKNEEVRQHIKMHISWLEKELFELEKSIQQKIDKDPDLKAKNDLLQSIPGIGEKTSATMLAYVAFERFKSARELAAFIGLNPRQRTSGTSIRGRTKLSKTGNAYLRKSLYMPSIAAIRFNSTIKRFAAQLTNNGKRKMVIIGAVMRKLVHVMYGVLKSNQPFDPAYRANQ
jgi:transposase